MHEYLEIGKIANTHGVRGELKVIPLTDNPERYNDLQWVFVGDDKAQRKYDIESVKYFKGTVIVKLKGVNDMDGAEKLKNQFLMVDRENAVKLPPGSYFVCDLIGSGVFEENGNFLGTLKDIIQTGSNDVYVVRNEVEDKGRKEILIPALKSVVREISLEAQKIVVTLPEGLL